MQEELLILDLPARQDVDATGTADTPCAQCKSRGLCWPSDLDPGALQRVGRVVLARRTVKQGEVLIRQGERFQNVYAIQSGFFKTVVISSDGREQITGFQMTGEFVGLDGIEQDQHSCAAVALEDSEVCALPFARLEALAREMDVLQRHLHRVLSQDIVVKSNAMLLLSSIRGDKRLASVLINLAQRLHARGFPPTELDLRMTRMDLSNFVCLKYETVSRILSQLVADGILEIKRRHVRILDPAALKQLASLQAREVAPRTVL